MKRLKTWRQSLNNKEIVNAAENLYVYKLNTMEEIGAKLGISPKTASRWNVKYGWSKKRADFLKSKQCFHEELYELARKLMKDIVSDIDSGEKIDTGRMYSFCKILPMFLKVKDYEDVIARKNEPQKPKGLTADIIAQIEEEVLGIQRLPEPNLNDDKPE